MLKNKVLLLALFFGGTLSAQHNQLSDFTQPSKIKNYIVFKDNNPLTTHDLVNVYKEELGLSSGDQLNIIRKEDDNLGFTHYRYQQYHQGVKVYGAQYLVHEKNKNIVSSNGKLVKGIVSSVASINGNNAVLSAIKYVGAEKYMWENSGEEQLLRKIRNDNFATHYPDAELVYYDKYFSQTGSSYKLAYKIEIYSEKPLAKQDVFVDAQTGEIIHSYNKIHTAEVTGTANTKYAGTQSIQTDSLSSTSYRLREYARGGGIETYNMLQGTNYGAAVDFTDSDNIWNNINTQQDEAATDAHWAAEMTYDYFLGKHGRNSYDNLGSKLLSYVHYDQSYSNAFWDGVRMTYGDGDGGTYTALTSLDVGGHEITHGVTEYSANLVYQNESGALNESFSDIFGTAIEYYADFPNFDWFIGEDFDINGNGFRSMSDPNSKNDPDTYLGNNWEFGVVDNGGVHTNSSVQNFWFYLLTAGGTGTNDNNYTYSVSGLGIDTAAAIAYRNLSVYLTQSSEYIDARNGAIQSAKDLYGNCSNAMIQTSKAWAAVGVGFAIEDNDLAIIAIENPATACGLTNAESVTIKIRNNGCLVNIPSGNTIPVAFQIDGGGIVNEVITLSNNFNAGDTLTYTFTNTANLSTIGMHTVSSWVKYSLDNQPLNDSIIAIQVENKLQQNVDVALVKVLSPNSGCHLSNAENVQVAVKFLGCDSLASGTNINLAYQLNGGLVVNEILTLANTIFSEDTVYYTFTGVADLSTNGTHSLDAWTAFTIDNINGNDTLANYSIKHPYSLFNNDWVSFEDNIAVLDTILLTSNVQSDASVSNASSATGNFALRMTGGDPINSGIIPDLDSNNFWNNNIEYAAFAKFCVDASGWAGASMYFDLRQTLSKVYSVQFGQPVPAASSLRVVVNGVQVGNVYNPATETGDPFVTQSVDLNAYAGTLFEVVFETRMGFSKAADPLAVFPFNSEGDNAFIDNVRFSQHGVGIKEHTAIEKVEVYPNPNKGTFVVHFDSEINQEITLEIYNVLGSIIYSDEKLTAIGTNNININLMDQTDGIYFVKLTTMNKTHMVRVIKN